MPAVALRPLEEEAVATLPLIAPSPSPGALPAEQGSNSQTTPHENFEWRHVADYVDRFSGFEELDQSPTKGKRKVRHHRRFAIFTSFNIAAVIVFCQLLGLVWLRAVDLQAMREASRLDQDIRRTSESIARTQKRIAAATSKPILAQWAGELGYRAPLVTDFDDVTKNTPPPATYTRESGEAIR